MNTSASSKNDLFVTVIVPCHNERDFIGPCIESILGNDFPRDRLEILVVDGMSDDGSREKLADIASKIPHLRILDNPRKITPTALNIGIRNARGDVIIWMSSHSDYPSNYISSCVSELERHGVDNVGGSIVAIPRENNLMGRAIVAAISHPFGVGNSHFRTRPQGPKWVDTVFGGCYRRSVFNKIGLFNEELVRGQDLELNLRLRAAGGKILLSPNISSNYYARSDLISFWKHNWTNGIWAILPFTKSNIVPVTFRHIVPLLFVISLLLSAALYWWEPARYAFVATAGMYGLVNLAASCHAAWKTRQFNLILCLPVAFSALHFGYGLGSLWGLVLAAKEKIFRKKESILA